MLAYEGEKKGRNSGSGRFSSGMFLDTVLPYWLFGWSVFILTGLFSAALVQQVASANPVYCKPALVSAMQ